MSHVRFWQVSLTVIFSKMNIMNQNNEVNPRINHIYKQFPIEVYELGYSMRPLSNPGPLRGVGRRACSALAARKDGQTWAHDFWWEKFGGLMSKTSKPRNFWGYSWRAPQTILWPSRKKPPGSSKKWMPLTRPSFVFEVDHSGLCHLS